MSNLSNDDFLRLSEPDKNAFYDEDNKRRPAYYKEGSRYCRNKTRRQRIAEGQSELKPASLNTIIDLANEVLVAAGCKAVPEPKLEGDLLESFLDHCEDKDFYERQLSSFGVNGYRDLVWMRFTDSGHVGVVGASYDINFPDDEKNSSYQLIRCCGLGWDTSFQLIFPLTSIEGCKEKRDRIETAIGNYLIENKIPIIDYYSHNYH